MTDPGVVMRSWRDTPVQWVLVTLSLLLAVSGSVWGITGSDAAVSFFWAPVPAAIFFIYFDADPRSRSTACLVMGFTICALSVALVLIGWIIYLPAGIFLILAGMAGRFR